MSLSERESDLLQEYLDGEASAEDAQRVRERLAADAEWIEAGKALREGREMRAAVIGAIEPTEAEAGKLAERIIAATKRRRDRGGLNRIGRIFAAVAACVALSFGAGWLTRGKQTTSPNHLAGIPQGQPATASAAYQVTLTDAQGQVIGVQKFGSLEQAKEFAHDLRTWQERQQKMREGAAVLVEDQY